LSLSVSFPAYGLLLLLARFLCFLFYNMSSVVPEEIVLEATVVRVGDEAAAQQQAPNPLTLTSKLKELQAAHKEGLLTEEEYGAAKQDLLTNFTGGSRGRGGGVGGAAEEQTPPSSPATPSLSLAAVEPEETVSVRMSADDFIDEVYYNGVDIRGSVSEPSSGAPTLKTFSFTVVPGAVLAVAANDNEPGTSASFYMRCTSSNPKSGWNNLQLRQGHPACKAYGTASYNGKVGSMGRPKEHDPPAAWTKNDFEDCWWTHPTKETHQHWSKHHGMSPGVWCGKHKFTFYRIRPDHSSGKAAADGGGGGGGGGGDGSGSSDKDEDVCTDDEDEATPGGDGAAKGGGAANKQSATATAAHLPGAYNPNNFKHLPVSSEV
jgi:hypothetical protein